MSPKIDINDLGVDTEFLRKMQEQAGIVPSGGQPEQPEQPVDATAAMVVGQPAPAWALKQSYENRMVVGGAEARYAMFPDEYEGDRPSIFERGAKGITLGLASMAPASLTVIGGILEFLSTSDAGENVAEFGLSMEEWLNDHLAVDNPNLVDHDFVGVGSLT